MAPSELPSGQYKSDKQRARFLKRKVISDSLTGTREELFAGGFEG
jgi:tRNA (adenine58-N1)-methyltransferase non-catalytic subunit